MPLPLLWIGAAAVSALAVKGLADDRQSQQRKRFNYCRAQTLADLAPYESAIATYPTDMLLTEQQVKPVAGAIVCCGIGGVLDHTGIWVGEDTIIELDGNGLIKPVSAQRFTDTRTGKGIFIACDSLGVPLASEMAAHRAVAQIFQVRDYHLLDSNCHQFIWECFQTDSKKITTFKALSLNVADLFDRVVYWDRCL
ncbi:MAG: hypothetical protein AXW17_08595 [Colwellia sp. Phe_37]|jgi:hypothetical protein|nr:MAG: hypothetical protein AXW17_08595 [Colwellia sp. Phe_37]|tara:strand:+ start:3782 stop:4369 length:588 start_codon:yes stop_codon:yes gene_type:complete